MSSNSAREVATEIPVINRPPPSLVSLIVTALIWRPRVTLYRSGQQCCPVAECAAEIRVCKTLPSPAAAIYNGPSRARRRALNFTNAHEGPRNAEFLDSTDSPGSSRSRQAFDHDVPAVLRLGSLVGDVGDLPRRRPGHCAREDRSGLRHGGHRGDCFAHSGCHGGGSLFRHSGHPGRVAHRRWTDPGGDLANRELHGALSDVAALLRLLHADACAHQLAVDATDERSGPAISRRPSPGHDRLDCCGPGDQLRVGT